MTLPIILAFNQGDAEEQEFWRTILDLESDAASTYEVSDAELEQALSLLIKHGALEETANRARHHGKLARAALADLPQGKFYDGLIETVDFCIERIS